MVCPQVVGLAVGAFLDLQRAMYPTWDADLEGKLASFDLPDRGNSTK